ncbi:MAG: TIGR02147 family protein [Bdellovibrionales bacterium]|nr:TIGR02147 family protein [Bdellovibrionales bacterium]
MKATEQNNNTAHRDFRALLTRELQHRMRMNSRYSLRAFARDLGVDPSHLSKLLRGHKPITLHFIEEASGLLKLTEDERNYYRDLHLAAKSYALAEVRTYAQLSQDVFEIVADWQNFAILELMKVSAFKPEATWIAQRLRVPVSEVEESISRLKRSGLLKVDEHGVWTDTSQGFSTHILGPNVSSVAHRRAQKEILEMAAVALQETPIEKRDQSSMMMATSFEKLKKAKEMIRDFRRHLTAFLEEGEDKDAVFQLSISLFPLSEIEAESNKKSNWEATHESN